MHKKLQDIFPGGLVLLGGSYLYGEASEKSDVDFYAIISWRDFFERGEFLHRIKALKLDYPELKVTFMPRLLFRRGWYYVYGKDLGGALHCSKINRKIIFRNAVKLSYFHYVNSLLAEEPRQKKISVRKSAQQLTLAAWAASAREMKSPLFLVENLQRGIGDLPAEKKEILSAIIGHKLNDQWWQDKNLSELGRAIFNCIVFIYNLEGKKFLNFSIVNYLLYNARFLAKGNYKFLFRNPDKYLLGKIFNCLTSPACDIRELSGQLREVIFPIYIV